MAKIMDDSKRECWGWGDQVGWSRRPKEMSIARCMLSKLIRFYITTTTTTTATTCLLNKCLLD